MISISDRDHIAVAIREGIVQAELELERRKKDEWRRTERLIRQSYEEQEGLACKRAKQTKARAAAEQQAIREIRMYKKGLVGMYWRWKYNR